MLLIATAASNSYLHGYVDQNNQNYQSIERLISWDDLLKLIFPMNLRSMSYNSGKETRSYGLLVHDFLPNCMIFFHFIRLYLVPLPIL